MRSGVIVLAAACAVLVVGCAPAVNETNFAAGREALVGSPALYKQNVAKCVTSTRQNPILMEQIATFTNESKERAPELACERMTRAFRDGRYTHKIYIDARQGSISPELVKIIQGR